MYRITFCLGDLRDPDLARQQLLVMMGALAEADALYLRSHPRTPTVAQFLADPSTRIDEDAQGVQPPEQEAWQDVPTLLRRRRDGLCAAGSRDLAAWRMAELMNAGEQATISLQRSAGDERSWRPVIVRASGAVEDLARGGGFRRYEDRERITLVLNLFDGEQERQLSHRTLEVLLHCLTHIDVLYLRRHPETPRLYDSHVRYMEEPPGQEEWQDVPTCLRMGDADCEDMACWRAAELQVRGESPGLPSPAAQALLSRGRFPPAVSIAGPGGRGAYP